MATYKEFHIKGGRAIDQTLAKLPIQVERNIMRGALKAGVGDIRDEARNQLAENGSNQTGLLSQGIKTSSRIERRGQVVAKVKTTGKHAFLANWVEHGTAAHAIFAKNAKALFLGLFRVAVDHPGARPHPFMRPALDKAGPKAFTTTANYVRKRLTKEGLRIPDADFEEEGQ